MKSTLSKMKDKRIVLKADQTLQDKRSLKLKM